MTIEDIILRHGQRGMDILREFSEENFCQAAAQCIYDAPRGNVLLTPAAALGRPTGLRVRCFWHTHWRLWALPRLS